MSLDYTAIGQQVSDAISGIQDVDNAIKGTGTINRKGEQTGPAYDPTYGEPVALPVNLLIGSFTTREIDGTNILATDIKITIPPTGLPDDLGPFETLITDAMTYSIIKANPLKPAGVVVMWVLQCRA